MTLQGSYALMLELGDAPDLQQLNQLHEQIWALEQFQGPEHVFSARAGFPPPAQGRLAFAGGDMGCYTRFERDTLGYPTGWQSPVLLTIGLDTGGPLLPESPHLQQCLEQILFWVAGVQEVRLAVIGHSSIYHVNADFVSEDWLNLHHALLVSLWLKPMHPLVRQWHLDNGSESMIGLRASHWQQCVTDEDEQQKYLSYKQKLSQALHTPVLRLEWE